MIKKFTWILKKEILKDLLERRKKIIEKGQFRIALINKEIQEYQAMMIEKKEEIKDITESKNVILYELYKIKRFFKANFTYLEKINCSSFIPT